MGKPNKIDVINVLTLFKMDIDKIVKLKKNIHIRFEDDVIIKCKYNEIITFRFLLNFITKYDVPITSELWLSKHFKNKLYSSGTHTSLYSKVFRAIVKPYLEKHGTNDIMDPLFRDMYQTVNMLSSKLLSKIAKYNLGLDVMDILMLQFDKDVIDALIEVKKTPSPGMVKEGYGVLNKTMYKPYYADNVISILYRSAIASTGQINQLLFSRGYISGLNNRIYQIPMTNSFMLGFMNIYEAAIESTAGAKALHLSGTSIQNTEYTNRQLQLAVSVLEQIYHGDCGKPKYTSFYVKDDVYDNNGTLITSNYLTELEGKRYLDSNGVEKVISVEDKHLIGTTIMLRQAINCGHPDKKGICSACVGEVADSIFEFQSLGVLCVVMLMAVLSQGLLSAKHLLINALSSNIELNNTLKKYFMIRNNEDLYFRANIINKKTKRVYLKIPQKEATGISNIHYVKDIFSININKVSRIKHMSLLFIDKDGNEEEIELDISKMGNGAFLSLQFLSHVIKKGFDVYDDEHYMIEINDYDNKKPIIKFDKLEYSLATLNHEFKEMLKSHKYNNVNGVIRSEYTPEVLVQKLFDLLKTKISVNISLIEVIVYAFTAKDISRGNYDLGRGARTKDVIGFKHAIDYRSLGMAYDWDDLQGKVFNPILYSNVGKVSSPMDVYLKPNEVVKYDTDSRHSSIK